MAEYSDWESLVAAAQKECPKILTKHVKPVMEDIVLSHILTDIYWAYEPKEGGWFGGTYQRRGSLLDEENLYYELQDRDTTLLVTSKATPSPSVIKGYSFHNRRPGAFLKMLEGDDLGIWSGGFPRPAISNAQEEINRSGDIVKAIQTGINEVFI